MDGLEGAAACWPASWWGGGCWFDPGLGAGGRRVERAPLHLQFASATAHPYGSRFVGKGAEICPPQLLMLVLSGSIPLQAPAKNASALATPAAPLPSQPVTPRKNKAAMCKPLMQNRGVSCKIEMKSKGCQTGEGGQGEVSWASQGLCRELWPCRGVLSRGWLS